MKKQWIRFRESNYSVSEIGEIINQFGKILKPVLPALYKYKSYSLKINGKAVNVFEHRAVAECFILNPLNKPQVNHRDGNKLNNHYSNLEWVTQSENIQHMYDTGLKTYRPLHYKGKFGAEHNRSKSVMCIETGVVYGSQSEASRLLNISNTSVSWAIKHGRPIYGMHFQAKI